MPIIFKSGDRTFSFLAESKQRKLDAMERIGWTYVNSRTEAIHRLWDRLIDAACRNHPLTVRQWTKGVPVRVTIPGTGASHTLDLISGQAIDREIANELVTFMSARSFFEGEVLVGSFLFDVHSSLPPPSFFTWLSRVGLFNARSGVDQRAFVIAEMSKARRHYSETDPA